MGDPLLAGTAAIGGGLGTAAAGGGEANGGTVSGGHTAATEGSVHIWEFTTLKSSPCDFPSRSIHTRVASGFRDQITIYFTTGPPSARRAATVPRAAPSRCSAATAWC